MNADPQDFIKNIPIFYDKKKFMICTYQQKSASK